MDIVAIYKALHVIFMVTWFAGLFYLPRLFVYHCEATDKISLDRFQIMEKKLFIIMSIGMLLTLVFGVLTVYQMGAEWFKTAKWLHIKVTLVIVLVVYHHVLIKFMKELRTEPQRRSSRFFRILNEVPAIFLIAIVVIAVGKHSVV